MAITADFHIHSLYSGDSDAPMEAIIKSAIQKGLDTICFTEHHDEGFPYDHDEKQDGFLLNTDSYLYELLQWKEKYADRIRILFGVELGVQSELVRSHLKYAKAHEFDFIIASSHLCRGKDPYYPDFYQNRSEQEAYREYFECILENVSRFSCYDVYGHLDYVVRYGPSQNREYSYSRYRDILDEILRTLIEREKGIEVNTGGLKYGLGDTNPCTDIIRRYRELGGEIITIGSDAHIPENTAYEFTKAEEILKNCGFRYYTVFERRMPEFRRLT